jgi:hypothetical protein
MTHFYGPGKVDTIEALREAADQLAQYAKYSDEMAHIGRGFYPSAPVTTESLIQLIKAIVDESEGNHDS